MIPFDTWDMQSMRENRIFFIDYYLQMTLNYEKIYMLAFFMHIARENQNSVIIALPYQYSS